MRLFATAIALATTFAAATPAAAVFTTFASFTAGPGGANFLWTNAITSGVFFSTANNSANQPGGRLVTFNLLDSKFSNVGPIAATWTMQGIVTNTVAVVNGTTITQNNLSGSFSFINTGTFNIKGTTFLPGRNLLSGTFNTTSISGTRGGTSADFTGTTPASSIVYISDFYDFAPGSNYDFNLDLDSINPTLNALPVAGTPNRALRGFRAVTSGTFSSDPAAIATIPEPTVWLQLIAGFGLVGAIARRRQTNAVA